MASNFVVSGSRAGLGSVVVTDAGSSDTFMVVDVGAEFDIATSINANASISGVSSTTAIGTLVAERDASVTLSGVQSTSGIGTLSATQISSVTLTGVQTTSTFGNLSETVDEAYGFQNVAIDHNIIVSSTNLGFPTTFRYALASFWFIVTDWGFVPQFSWLDDGGSGAIDGLDVDFSSTQIGITCLSSTVTGHPYIGQAIVNVTLNQNTLYNVLVSVDSVGHQMQLYINDAPISLTPTWITSNPMHVAENMALQAPQISLCFGDLWYSDTASFYDLSVTANRRAFINSDLTPVYPGGSGQLPIGSIPRVFLHCPQFTGHGSDWAANAGTGGSFSPTPLLGGCSASPSPTVTLSGREVSADIGETSFPRSLQLVTLYPMQTPSDVYAIANMNGADFPDTFSQLTVSMWCCEHVNLRAPNSIDTPISLDMQFSPTQASLSFYDASSDTLFSGTFHNPGQATSEYHVMFSIDTQAQTYTLWVASGGPSVQWTSTDAAFVNVGDISNTAA